MYRPKNYARCMAYASALRELADRPTGLLVAASLTPAVTLAARRERFVQRVVARLNDLAEVAYLIGHDEGYVDGKAEGVMEGKDEANCHSMKDEEWEARVSAS